MGDAAAGFLTGILLSNLLAAAWLGLHPEDSEISLGGQGLAAIGLWIGLVGSAWLASQRKGARNVRADFGFALRPLDAGTGFVAGALAQLVLVPLIALLLRPVLGDPDVSTTAEEVFEQGRGPGLVVLVLFVVLGAAVVEELFFRGLLLRALERRFGAPWAVASSSVLFGLAHPQDLPAAGLVLVMVSLSALGAVLAVLVVKTGRLGPAIVAHATFNAWTAFFILSR